jgi:hypothetical protein
MGDLKQVLKDYQKYYDTIREYSEEKVKKTVSNIKDITNSKYSADGIDGDKNNIIVPNSPISYKMQNNKSTVNGFAYATPNKNFIYLEFGTRQRASDTLRIQTDFESRINTNSIAAPYKSNNTKFVNQKAITGRYYFLNTIDLKGVEFCYTFGKKL